jgi:pseudouridine kinase
LSRHVLAIGGAHVDRRARTAGKAVAGASNPGRWFSEAGGAALNVASTLALLGNHVRLVAPRGGDAEGETVAAAAARAGIEDCPVTYLDRATATYTAVLDSDGSLIVAVADMAIYDVFGPRQVQRRRLREAIAAADLVVFDANLPAQTLLAIARCCRDAKTQVAAIGVSPAKVIRLAGCAESLAALFLNEAEASAFCGRQPADPGDWPDLLSSQGLKAGVITRGGEPAVIFEGGRRWLLPGLDNIAIVDVTGAGDAFAAATIDALSRNLPLVEAARFGVAAAALTLAQPTAVWHGLDRTALETMALRVPAPTAL